MSATAVSQGMALEHAIRQLQCRKRAAMGPAIAASESIAPTQSDERPPTIRASIDEPSSSVRNWVEVEESSGSC
jgi:hypothetical protein